MWVYLAVLDVSLYLSDIERPALASLLFLGIIQCADSYSEALTWDQDTSNDCHHITFGAFGDKVS